MTLRPSLTIGLLLLSLSIVPSSAQSPNRGQPARLGLQVKDGPFDGVPAVIVVSVVRDSAASRSVSKTSGRPQPITVGDMVVAFAGETIDNAAEFADRISTAEAGKTELVIQSIKTKQIQHLWVELPPAIDAARPPGDGPPVGLSIGLTVRACKSGIHIDAIVPGSPATVCTEGKTGMPIEIVAGSHVLSINGIPVSTPNEVATSLASARGPIHVEIEQPKMSDDADSSIVLCVIGQ